MDMKPIYIVEIITQSDDKRAYNHSRKGYENGLLAFEYTQKFINANPAKWKYVFGKGLFDEICIEGNGLFYTNCSSNNRERGTTTIKISRIDIAIDEPEKMESLVTDDICIWNGAHTEKICAACEHRLTCKEYHDMLAEKYYLKKVKIGELGSFSKRL